MARSHELMRALLQGYLDRLAKQEEKQVLAGTMNRVILGVRGAFPRRRQGPAVTPAPTDARPRPEAAAVESRSCLAS